MSKYKTYSTFVLLVTLCLWGANVAMASSVSIPIRDQLAAAGGFQMDLGFIVSTVVTVAMTLGIIALLLYFVRGAYLWLTSGGDKAQVEQARSVLTNGLIGMTILASVFALYGIIDQFFGLGTTVPNSGPGSINCTGGAVGCPINCPVGEACTCLPSGTCYW